MSHIWLTLNNAFSPTTAVGEADIVSCVSASGCHSSGPKGASPGQKALLHGISKIQAVYLFAKIVIFVMTHRLVLQISFKCNSFRSDSLWTDHNLILYCRWKTPSSLMRSTALLRPLSCWLHMPSRPSMVTTRERFTLPASYPQTDSSQRGSCNSTSFQETSGKTGTLQTTSKDKFKGRRC